MDFIRGVEVKGVEFYFVKHFINLSLFVSQTALHLNHPLFVVFSAQIPNKIKVCNKVAKCENFQAIFKFFFKPLQTTDTDKTERAFTDNRLKSLQEEEEEEEGVGWLYALASEQTMLEFNATYHSKQRKRSSAKNLWRFPQLEPSFKGRNIMFSQALILTEAE